jgi:uncharacterized protein (TIGR03437 family)
MEVTHLRFGLLTLVLLSIFSASAGTTFALRPTTSRRSVLPGDLSQSRTFTYMLQPSGGDRLAQANSMGAQGFAYYALLSGGNLYVKDSSHASTYSYRLAAADTLAQMNELGVQGFAFYIPLTGGSLYVKDSSHDGTYSYRQLPSSSSADDTQAQMNAQGAQGFEFYAPFTGGNIYVKDSAYNESYGYALPLAPSSAADTLTQLNAQGAQGFALLSRFAFIAQLFLSGGVRNILVKDSSRSGTYSFAMLPEQSSAAANLAQFNERGAQGFQYLLTLFFGGGSQNIYMKFGASQTCAYALAPRQQRFDATGGDGAVSVTAQSGCVWTAASDAAWITVMANTSGNGNGSVSYGVAANTSASQRTGTLRVAGQTLTVTQAGASASASAASFSSAALASESIAAAFGASLSTSVQIADSVPLPTSLAGTTVKVKDSLGIERLASLFFVAPTQINYLIPGGTANGAAAVTITNGNGSVSTGVLQIAAVAPGLFSANASGQGVAAAVALRVKADGSQTYEPVARYDQAQQRFVAAPIDLGPSGEQVYLLLYGTGFRNNTGTGNVRLTIGGTDVPVLYASFAPGFFGLDQINAGALPRNLAGRGELDAVLTVDGKSANTVRVSLR